MTLPLRYLDTETTGFAAGRDKVVEIAILDADGNALLNTLVNPERSIPAASTAVHGIRDQDVRTAPRWHEIEDEVVRLLAGCELVGHNIAFDVRFLGRAKEAPARVTCTMGAWKSLHGKSIKLGVAASQIGYTPSGAYHRAAADAETARAVHLWLLPRLQAPAVPPVPAADKQDAPSVPGLPSAGSGKREKYQPILAGSCCAEDDPRLVAPDRGLCPEPTLRGAPWTEAADRKLIEMWENGADVLAILRDIPRTPVAIFLRLERLGAIPAGKHPFA